MKPDRIWISQIQYPSLGLGLKQWIQKIGFPSPTTEESKNKYKRPDPQFVRWLTKDVCREINSNAILGSAFELEKTMHRAINSQIITETNLFQLNCNPCMRTGANVKSAMTIDECVLTVHNHFESG